MKNTKQLMVLLFAAALTLGMTSCENSTAIKSSKSDNQTVSKTVQKPAYNPITKWEFTDYRGYKHSIEINKEEGTVQLHSNGRTEYGSFRQYNNEPGKLYINIPYEMDGIKIYFEKPYTPFSANSPLSSAVIDINNNYLYVNDSAYDAKDPTRRIKVSKR